MKSPIRQIAFWSCMLIPLCVNAGEMVTPQNVDRQSVGLKINAIPTTAVEEGIKDVIIFHVIVTAGELELTECIGAALRVRVDASGNGELATCDVAPKRYPKYVMFMFTLQESALEHSTFTVTYEKCGDKYSKAAWRIDLSSFVPGWD